MKKIPKAIALSLMLLSGFGLSSCYAQPGDPGPGNQPGELARSDAGLRQVLFQIHTSNTVHTIVVEVAESHDEQAQGLMFRTALAPNKGMIFPFAEDRVASFWMKNTVIPLDIIFIRRDGSIGSIAAETTPYSLTPVRSGEPIATVLEIAAGRASELGIEPGDTVTWQR